MPRSFIIVLIIAGCSIILISQQNTLAQAKGDQKSPRAMVQQLQQEIEELQADLAENPSSSKAQKIKSRIQWNIRKIKEINPDNVVKDEPKSKPTDNKKSGNPGGKEQYATIIKNNLFTPLGSGGEAKRREYILTGILGNSAFIQLEGSPDSHYVTEGQSFGNGAKLVQVGENSVTIIHEGVRKELWLNEGESAIRSGGSKGGGARSSERSDSKKMEADRRAEKERQKAEKENWDKGEKSKGDNSWASKMSVDELSEVRGDIGRYIEGLEKKGVKDPEQYKGALEKMETVERAMAEKENSE